MVQAHGAFEVREYDARLAAETEVAGSEYAARSDGFQRLARYIFGANTSRSGIAMTAPVAQEGGSHTIAMTAPVGQARSAQGEWRIRFFMPAKYTEATLPRPNDPAVKIVPVPGETYGVYRYTGSTSPSATARADRELLRRLAGAGYVPACQPVAWFYDPPWTLPFLRRNEAAVVVTKAPAASDAGRP